VDIRDRIDPEVRAALDAYLEIVGPDGLSGIADLSVRRQTFTDMAVAGRPPDVFAGLDVRDMSTPVDDGAADAPLRVYSPREMDGASPGILFIHGGGLLIGSLDAFDEAAAGMSRAHGAVVVAVDYRKAPEHRYPAAVEDCYAAFTWFRAREPRFPHFAVSLRPI
jgi:acetyl esterase/lipase